MPLVQVLTGSVRVVDIVTLYWRGVRKLHAHLFRNDIVPTIHTTRENLTECGFPGYAPQEVSGWTPAHIVHDRARSEADPIYFLRGSGAGAESVFGYWVAINDQPEVVIFAERFPDPIVMDDEGLGFRLYLIYTQGSDPDFTAFTG